MYRVVRCIFAQCIVVRCIFAKRSRHCNNHVSHVDVRQGRSSAQ
jgi:hypothetical protein